MSERCQSCGRDWTDHPGIMATCAENARLKAHLTAARAALAGIAKTTPPSDPFDYAVTFEEARLAARDFFAEYPEEP